ncbi:hypothetical protein [Halomonas sp. 707B3]|uniref:hypothetical protein n=1 Tax=Halomonas sp. 707B3 TaxID=1681043 RepID=UPI00209FBFC4|nr:hypothetical protein [Halomonas sp. 707B3]MCP1317585.1 hypothetical protein [Halomonas sp. 707B3]
MSAKLIPPITIDDTNLVATNAPETPQEDAATYDPGATYAKGARVQVPDTHTIYESAIANNTGNYPPDNLKPAADGQPAKWLRVMATNPRAMFDGRVGTLTTGNQPWIVGTGNGLQIEVAPGRVVNNIVLFGLVGVSVTAEVDDPVEGVVWQRTRSLTANTGINNMYAYLFDPIERRTDIAFLDLPSYGTATIRISIESGGGEAACGLCLIGQGKNLGLPQWGINAGIRDYSRIEDDEFGITDFVQRGYVRRASIDLLLEKNQTNGVYRYLAKYRATPAVWVGYEEYEPTLIYGVFTSFDIIYPHAAFDDCSIEIRGILT